MDWIVGKVVFPPCATPAYPRPRFDSLQQFQRWLTDVKAVEPVPAVQHDEQYPCGWDERDAKV